MIVASCRRNFTRDRGLGSKLAFRNHTHPNNVDSFKDLTLEGVLEHATNQHVAILVHGFKNPISNVMSAYWDLVERMRASGVTGPTGYGLVIGFTWPGFQTGIGYFPAMSSAKKSGPFLFELVNTIRSVAHSVDVETHSLGARVALTALSDPRKVFVDNLLLTAPAVDHHLMEPDEKFHRAIDSCNRCFVYHSKNDPVLRTTYPIADIADGVHKALGRTGPRSKQITLGECTNAYVVDCSPIVKSHGGYRKEAQFYDHWRSVLSGSPLDRYSELS